MVRTFTARLPELEEAPSSTEEESEEEEPRAPREVEPHELVQGLTRLPSYIANVIGYGYIDQLRHAVASHLEVLSGDDEPVRTVLSECLLRKRAVEALSTSLSAKIAKLCSDVMTYTDTTEEVAMPVTVAVMLGASTVPPYDKLKDYLSEFAHTGGPPQLDGSEAWPSTAPTLSAPEYATLLVESDPDDLLALANAVGLLGRQGGSARARIRRADLHVGHRRSVPVVCADLDDVRLGRQVPEGFTVQRAPRAAASSPRTCRRKMRAHGLRYLEKRRHTGGARTARPTSETKADAAVAVETGSAGA